MSEAEALNGQTKNLPQAKAPGDWLEVGDCLQGQHGSYLIERRLHVSPQLVTAQVRELKTGETLVLKELRLDRLQSWKVMELFEREIGVLKHLQDPYLPRYVDDFCCQTAAESCLYLVCSWAPGESLQDKLDAGWQPEQEQVWEIARQVLERLIYLQRFQPPVIHRDLKPGNLVLDPDAQVHLVDLGSVQGVLNPDGGSTVVGTFGYMPPEQFSDQCVPATDLYALGVTLVQLLTGKDPADLPRKGMKLVYQEQLNCQPFYLEWLEKMLAPELEKRFEDAEEALAALEQSPARTGRKQQPQRIQTLARGTQLKILVGPAQGSASLGYPVLISLALILWGAWGYLEYYLLLLDTGRLSGMSNALDVFWRNSPLGLILDNFWSSFLIASGFGSLLKRALDARSETLLQLQPDRFVVEQSLWRFKRRFEGATSELLRLEKRWCGLSSVCKLVERSGLEHKLVYLLGHRQRRELAGQIAAYLQGLDSQQADRFLAQTLEPVWREKHLVQDLRLIKEKFEGLYYGLQSSLLKGLSSFAGLLPADLARIFKRVLCLERVKGTQLPEAYQIVIGHRCLSLGWLGNLSGLLLTLLAAASTLGESVIYQQSGWVYALSHQREFLWAALAYLGVSAFFARRVLRSVFAAQIQTRWLIQNQSYQVEHVYGFFDRFSRSFKGQFKSLEDIEILTHGAGRGDFVWTESGSRPQIAGFWLSYHDIQALTQHLQLALAGKELRPLLPANLTYWQTRLEDLKQIGFGQAQRVQIQTLQERLLIRIPAYGLRGSLFAQSALGLVCMLGFPFVVLIVPWLGQLMFFAGISLWLSSLWLSKLQTTLSLEPGKIRIRHQLGKWQIKRQLNLGPAEPERPLRFQVMFKSLSLKYPHQPRRRLGFYLSEEDIQVILHQIHVCYQQHPEK